MLGRREPEHFGLVSDGADGLRLRHDASPASGRPPRRRACRRVMSWSAITARRWSTCRIERLVLDTAPGSLATLQVVRQGQPLVIDIRVTEVPTEERA